MSAPTSPANAEVGQLYQHHHLWLQHWLRRRLSCPQRAADLMQELGMKVDKGQRVVLSVETETRKTGEQTVVATRRRGVLLAFIRVRVIPDQAGACWRVRCGDAPL